MLYIVRKSLSILKKYAQVLFVLIAFTLMVLFSYFFVSNNELTHLRNDANNAIRYTEANIKSDMLEPETLLGGVSETIVSMVLQGDDKDTVNEYLAHINDYVWDSNERRLYGVTGLFGVFDIFDGMMLIGSDSWIPPDEYDMKNRPWYTGAIEAAGEVGYTEPYFNVYSNQITITFFRRIFNRDGSPIGIICLNIELNRIMQHAVNARFAEDGYGFLLSGDLIIIAHPNSDLVGLSFREVRSDISGAIDIFYLTGSISEVTTTDYRGVMSISFVQRLYNGWYMGVVTPRDKYFQGTRDLALYLAVLGMFFAGFLIWMLMNITRQKNSADHRMKIMFDLTPLSASFMDKNFNIIDCNQHAVKMYGLSSKQEYIDKFPLLTPEYQPDGTLSIEKGLGMIHKTLNEGFCTYEWMGQTLDREPIPCENTLIRVNYMNDYIIVGYNRDLREEKQMTMEIQQRARLLDTVNTAAAILLANTDMTAFETSLLKCFDLLGRCLDVDRVQIWRNELIESELHFALRYEWLSDFGKTRKPIPIGLMFPYSIKKEWEELFGQGECINSPLNELPYEDRAFLGYYEMKSIVIIPMFSEGNFWGFFSIDDCRRERRLSPEEISILTSAGIMMISAVNRNTQALRMREAEERTKIMIDAAPLCAIFWNKNIKIIDCNQEAVKMFGVSSKEEFIGRFFDLMPEYQPDGAVSKDQGYRLIKKTLEEGYDRFEWMHQRLDGEPIPVEVTCVRVKHKDEYTVTEYIRDLREQKAMIAEMKKAEIAEESSKAKSDFLAKMSHEIRTPMNAILGITEIQLQDESHQQGTKEAFERIYNSGDLLLHIINDILDLSKIEAGKLVLVPGEYDIASLINDTIQLVMMRYESKPIDFKLNVSEDIPLTLLGDELRIKQILNNILSNAFKYTEEGEIRFSIFCETKTPVIHDGGEKSTIPLVFVVSDTGQGMTADQVHKLGTEYSRFNMEANRKTEGTGLGMNITRNLIQLMGGDLSIESAPGKGSTFTVRLPQKHLGSSVIGKEVADNLMELNHDNTRKLRTLQMKRDFMPYGRVLVVDDVETNLYVAKGLLAPYGLSVETVISGFEAVDKIREENIYDIIFMDHMMPRMDGIEATKIIRSLGYNRPIVALTANALAGQAEMFLENGFDDFISKPIDIRQLNVVLNKLIRDLQPPEVVEQARKQKESKHFKKQKPVEPQLAEFFIKDAKKTVAVLEAIYINKCRRVDDISMFIINTHAMKSALANIGETDVSSEAAKLEQAGRDNDIKKILSGLPAFLELLRDVIERLKPDENNAETGGVYEEYSYLIEKLAVLDKACEALDKKTSKKTLAEIREKDWPNNIKEQLAGIAEQLLHSDFEEACKIINGIMKRF